MYDRQTIYPQTDVKAFSNRVYGWMALGLSFSAVVAYLIFRSGAYIALMPFWWVWAFGTLGVAMAMNVALHRFSIATVATLFMAYAGLEGIMFGTILPGFAATFGGQVIWTAFATASVIFAIAMMYGMFTKADLTSLGKILTLGLMGLIGVTLLYVILSLFMQLPMMHLLISYLGLVIFVGLTAYDAQTIRQMSTQADPNSVAGYKLSLIMALKMYINVVMIFWYLLQILSSSNRR